MSFECLLGVFLSPIDGWMGPVNFVLQISLVAVMHVAKASPRIAQVVALVASYTDAGALAIDQANGC